MTEKSKGFLKLALRIAVTAALLGWVLSKIDLSHVASAIKTAKWSYLFFIWAMGIVIYWIRSVKMRLILEKQDCFVSTGKIFCASAITSLYSLVIPGLMSTGVKWYILKQHTGKGSNIFSSMVYNQLTDFVIAVVFGLVALIITNPAGGWQLPVVSLISLVAVVGICILLLNQKVGLKAVNSLKFFLNPFPNWIRQKGGETLEQIQVFQAVGRTFHFKMILFNVAYTTIAVVLYVLAARAANINVSAVVIVWQFVIIYMLGKLPISVANLGVREVTLIGMLALYGVDAPSALLMSMILFTNIILMATIGAVLQLCRVL